MNKGGVRPREMTCRGTRLRWWWCGERYGGFSCCIPGVFRKAGTIFSTLFAGYYECQFSQVYLIGVACGRVYCGDGAEGDREGFLDAIGACFQAVAGGGGAAIFSEGVDE